MYCASANDAIKSNGTLDQHYSMHYGIISAYNHKRCDKLIGKQQLNFERIQTKEFSVTAELNLFETKQEEAIWGQN